MSVSLLLGLVYSDLGIAADGGAPLTHTGGRGMEIAESGQKMGSYPNVQRLEPLLVSGYEQNGARTFVVSGRFRR